MSDNIGHGTSVASVVYKLDPNADFIIVKIFDNNQEPDEEILYYALQYIRDKAYCDIINISAGLSRCSDILKLKEICDGLTKKGVIIVSAFDNDGAMSYPAAFETVVGVDWSLSCFSPPEYQYVECSPITIRGMGYPQFLPTIGNSYAKQSGASFVAPIITGILCKASDENKITTDVWDYLRDNARSVCRGTPVSNLTPLKIHKAIIVSVTKETRALIEHIDMLPFEISQIYDWKYNGKVGKPLIPTVHAPEDEKNCQHKFTVKSVNDIDWIDSFDTVIIGHINMIGKASKKPDLKIKLLYECLKYNKQVYMFDMVDINDEILFELKKKGLIMRIPIVTKDNVENNLFGKLYMLNTPVVGVFGTSPKQGKFTLQLRMRKHLCNLGYKVSNFGTEPESELFGFEGTYPMGYNSTVKISGGEAITYINGLMHTIELMKPDIIFVGSQSQTVETGCDSLGYMTFMQHELILGTHPDAYILCVNPTDDLDYLKRTILYLESVTLAKVISIVIYPVVYKNENGYLTKTLKWWKMTK